MVLWWSIVANLRFVNLDGIEVAFWTLIYTAKNDNPDTELSNRAPITGGGMDSTKEMEITCFSAKPQPFNPTVCPEEETNNDSKFF